jgi:hypothetical protein
MGQLFESKTAAVRISWSVWLSPSSIVATLHDPLGAVGGSKSSSIIPLRPLGRFHLRAVSLLDSLEFQS